MRWIRSIAQRLCYSVDASQICGQPTASQRHIATTAKVDNEWRHSGAAAAHSHACPKLQITATDVFLLLSAERYRCGLTITHRQKGSELNGLTAIEVALRDGWIRAASKATTCTLTWTDCGDDPWLTQSRSAVQRWVGCEGRPPLSATHRRHRYGRTQAGQSSTTQGERKEGSS